MTRNCRVHCIYNGFQHPRIPRSDSARYIAPGYPKMGFQGGKLQHPLMLYLYGPLSLVTHFAVCEVYFSE